MSVFFHLDKEECAPEEHAGSEEERCAVAPEERSLRGADLAATSWLRAGWHEVEQVRAFDGNGAGPAARRTGIRFIPRPPAGATGSPLPRLPLVGQHSRSPLVVVSLRFDVFALPCDESAPLVEVAAGTLRRGLFVVTEQDRAVCV